MASILQEPDYEFSLPPRLQRSTASLASHPFLQTPLQMIRKTGGSTKEPEIGLCLLQSVNRHHTVI